MDLISGDSVTPSWAHVKRTLVIFGVNACVGVYVCICSPFILKEKVSVIHDVEIGLREKRLFGV